LFKPAEGELRTVELVQILTNRFCRLFKILKMVVLLYVPKRYGLIQVVHVK
jgi:hypothetical protein